MNKYHFQLSINAEQYCDEVTNEMVKLFNNSYNEALGRVNRHWFGNSFDDESLLFHMLPEEWANDIYYGVTHFGGKKRRRT
ncbi:hypothetical protein [Paenibacillus sp. FSL H8-0537]|uniref:hypothetical protein n=1 Tax=Paenibacillus sp. FSL H8-0537 TaxID=2921399 RepID=UPI003101954A